MAHRTDALQRRPGIDTHLDVHGAAVVDSLGQLLGTEPFPPTRAGEVELLTWTQLLRPP